MDTERKQAFRYLLHWAFVDIRTIEWNGTFLLGNRPVSLPVWLGRSVRKARRAGAVADWMHNLAIYSAVDFEGFDEGMFWREYDRLVQRYPELSHYKETFDRCLRDGWL